MFPVVRSDMPEASAHAAEGANSNPEGSARWHRCQVPESKLPRLM
jgi:hypothetical protein